MVHLSEGAIEQGFRMKVEPVVIDLKTQEKIWKGLLGRAVTRAELLSVYTGVTRSGAKVTTKIRSIRGRALVHAMAGLQ